MCSRYEAPTPERLQEEFGVEFDAQEKLELWPGYAGPFLRKPRNVDPYDDAVLPFEAEVGVFGLLPFWADKKLARSTYNARSETASVKRSFREAWKKAQHCIIPAVAIYEPDWRTGKAIPTRISRADGRLLGIAGLWEERKTAAGDRELSFSMLTVNAEATHLQEHTVQLPAPPGCRDRRIPEERPVTRSADHGLVVIAGRAARCRAGGHRHPAPGGGE